MKKEPKSDKNLTVALSGNDNSHPLSNELLLKLERLQQDYRWVSTNYDKLIEKFENEYIAVKDKKVFFTANTIEVLFARIVSANEHLDDFAIELIKKKPLCILL